MCCFLWHIALKLPCSPATQLVVTPGAWWLEDLSGCRMAQKTTRGFAPISKVLYAFVLNLFEYNGIINTSCTHTHIYKVLEYHHICKSTDTHTHTHDSVNRLFFPVLPNICPWTNTATLVKHAPDFC